MRPTLSKLRWCALSATIFGALALAAGCGNALPTAPLDPDDGVDAGADALKPPSTLDSGTPDAAVPDAAVPDAAEPVKTYAIGGSITGLQGAGLVLANDSETLDIMPGATSFVFLSKDVAGTPFSVTVQTQPSAPTQQCTVTGGTGTVVAGDVTTIAINCTTSSFTVGGTVTGLAGSGLVLTKTSGADTVDLPLNAVGTFAFPAQFSGSPYVVQVKTQPSNPTQECVVENGTGGIATANVTNLIVTCTTKTFAVGGTVTGLVGAGLVLTTNDGNDQPISSDGSFVFPARLSGSAYAVTVKAQPSSPTQECLVVDGTGTVGGADVTNISVTCTTKTFAVGGTVTGLVGTGLVLMNNGGDDVALGGNGTFAFPVQPSGSTYAVAVKAQPANPPQDCVVVNGAGTVGGANVTNVTVTCSTKSFAVGGTVIGLAGTGLVLTNNGGNDTTINSDGPFVFGTPVVSGASYVVAVKAHPTAPHQKCVVTNSTGTVIGSAVTTVIVSCKDVVYVDVTNGNNAQTGGPTDPWKNLTHAIANTRVAPVDILMAPGTYDAASGETFPIRPKSQQNIVGDIASKGAGTTPTVISGSGSATYPTGDAVGVFPHGIFFGAGVTEASLRGIQVQVAGGEGIGFDAAEVTIEAVTLKGSDDVAFVVANGSNVNVIDSDLQDGIWDVVVVDTLTKLKMRGTSLTSPTESAIVLGYQLPFTGSNIDLGTEASPGNNVIHGGPAGIGLWLQQSSGHSPVTAVGNTWKANVQGANAAGKYPTSFINGNTAVPYVQGRNYSITAPESGAGIQF